MGTRARLLGRMLVDAGRVQDAVVASALEEHRQDGERLGQTLIRIGAVPPETIAETVAQQLGLGFCPGPLEIDDGACELLGAELARTSRIAPIAVQGRSLTLAMVDPLDLRAIEDVEFRTGKRVEPRVATEDAITDALDRAFGGRVAALLAELPSSETVEPPDDEDLERLARRAPVVRLVDHLVAEAIDQGASDIHVEETGGDVRVRIRVDGLLRRTADLPASIRRALLSRIKIMAGLDISVRRRPQDGRIALRHRGRALTLRASTLPVNGGEKAVVRILDSESAPRGLDSIGLEGPDLASVRRWVSRGEGAILAAGPTGSGKSTTLFAAIGEVDRERRNVVTLEDPVEYRLEGANQVQVDSRAGLGFADALRAVLRQDPDVVMVGEIRDRETAEIAMTAAVTGHLVLSTIHTIDAVGAITRLLNMGVPPFLVAGGLAGVVAQRLVGRCCLSCRGAGCSECLHGIRGRTGIYQVLDVSDAMRDAVSRGAGAGELRAVASDEGMRTLSEDARRAVHQGLAPPHEAARIVLSASSGRACAGCGGGVPEGAAACPDCGRLQVRRCGCGERLERGWAYCPWCIRPVAA